MRASEIRLLAWEHVDFLAKSLVVGKSKTAAGTGRITPLNLRAIATLTHWHGLFPNAQPKHFVFPAEKYGFAGNDRKLCSYAIDPSMPMQRWKVGWESARRAAKVSCRFRGLRHTFISSLLKYYVLDTSTADTYKPLREGLSATTYLSLREGS
jgi:integrase